MILKLVAPGQLANALFGAVAIAFRIHLSARKWS
jgi:hypothetical protein